MTAEGFVLCRVIKIGEHGVLPDHDAEFVAQREELWRLIGHGAANADHVHAGFGSFSKPRLVIRPRTRQAHDVSRCPDSAPAKNGLPVYPEAETIAVLAVIHLDASEAGAPEPVLFSVQLQNDFVERWPAVGMRPPRLDIGYAEFAKEFAVVTSGKIGAVAGAGEPCGRDVVVCLKADVDHSRAGFVERRSDRAKHALLPYQADGSPWPGGMNFRAPARHIAECRGADQPQTLCVHHLRPPAGAGACFFEPRRECPAAD